MKLPGAESEYSMYATEGYRTGPYGRLRRFTYRVDGFVSVRAATEGALVTKPLRFSGNRLVVNFATSKQGSLGVEVQDAKGRPVDAFRLADCPEISGDAVEHVVSWRAGAHLGRLAGKTVRIRFQLNDADLYSFQFAK